MSKSGLDADRGAGAGRSRGATRGAERGGQAHASRETQAQQDTRSKLVDAAIRVFAREGFAAASTRMIAAESGVNLQAITYYFGGKGELYRGVVQHIADSMSAFVDPAAAAIEARLNAGAVTPEDARQMVHLALANIARALLIEASDDWARIILREQMQPGPEFEILFSSGMGRMLALLVRLTAIALQSDPAEAETRARALAMLGQVLVFRMARAAALRTLGWDKIGPDEFAVLERAIRINTNAILSYRPAEETKP
ncbi:MAG: CerR family C-terminal domain-containing protein [Caulobacterales bacterium]|jgi:AcrR family transcriptional regulator|nr:CerR family C-terminal domain-containing protein [Caulobacterales bacterium]